MFEEYSSQYPHFEMNNTLNLEGIRHILEDRPFSET